MASNTERRRRGTRIKQGLDELRNLDAPQAARPRTLKNKLAPPVEQRDDAPLEEEAASPRSLFPLPSHRFLAAVRQTPFAEDWSDWREVKSALFPSPSSSSPPLIEHQNKRRALLTIAGWSASNRSAAKSCVPRYIDATAVLVEAQLVDAATVAASSSTSVMMSAVSSAYATAISRAVHMMTGHLVTSRTYTQEHTTYRQRAQQIDFPPEAIEVRQQIAHGAFPPPLTALRWVAALVLQYLYTTYWMAQDAVVDALIAELRHDSAKREKRSTKKRQRDDNKEKVGGGGGNSDRTKASMEAMQDLLNAINSSDESDDEQADPPGEESMPLSSHIAGTNWTLLESC